jgi:hypothetical protein
MAHDSSFLSSFFPPSLSPPFHSKASNSTTAVKPPYDVVVSSFALYFSYLPVCKQALYFETSFHGIFI